MVILIVGSTGVLGKEAGKQLLVAGHKVRAMARSPEKANDLKQLGAEVVQGDLVDQASLTRACRGVDRVLAAAHSLMGTGEQRSERVDDLGHRALIDAAKTADVKHFVYTSAHGVSADHPVDFFRTKYKIEQYLKASGLPYTILRPSAFMEWHAHNLLGKSILETGKTTIYGRGDNPINFIAACDLGRIAVIALTDSKAMNKTIEVGGPQNFTRNQVAEMYGRLSGRVPKVSHVPRFMMRVLSPLLRPVRPVLSRLMALSVWGDTTDQTLDPTPMLNEFVITLTSLEHFIRERVAEHR